MVVNSYDFGWREGMVQIAEALLASMVEERYGADKSSVLLLDERMQRINIWEGGRIYKIFSFTIQLLLQVGN
jgi:hypothetical protein